MRAFGIPLRRAFGNPLRRSPQETPSGDPLMRAFGIPLRRAFSNPLRRPPQETPAGDPLRRAFGIPLRRPPQENHYWFRRPVSDTLRRTSNYPEKLSPLADFSNLFLILFNFLQKIRKFRQKTCTPESAHKKLQTFYEKSVNFYFFYNIRNIFFTVKVA